MLRFPGLNEGYKTIFHEKQICQILSDLTEIKAHFKIKWDFTRRRAVTQLRTSIRHQRSDVTFGFVSDRQAAILKFREFNFVFLFIHSYYVSG